MKNVILVDFDIAGKEWDYKNAIEEITHEKWELKECVTNKLHGSKLKVFLRYFRYFQFGFLYFIKRNQYDSILAWQQFYGLLIAFFCRLFKVKKSPPIYIMTFIYKPKNKLYESLIKYIVTSGYISKFIVLSDSEKEFYSNQFDIPQELFHCTRIGVSDVSNKYKKDSNREKYYLSVGRSNRDYKFLSEVWEPKYGKLIIICDSYKEKQKEGIEVLNNCYGDSYFEMLTNCFALIIPLSDVNVASGSLSFLQAMMLSVPIIVTENITVHDYINNTQNGFIIPKEKKALEDVLSILQNKEVYSQICENERNTYINCFSEHSLGKDIGKMILNSREKQEGNKND